MIELRADPYCQNCPEFEPVVDRDIREYTNFDIRDRGEKIFTECDTTIICAHKLRCYSMRNHIKRELETKEE
jgi:hypothetical protein